MAEQLGLSNLGEFASMTPLETVNGVNYGMFKNWGKTVIPPCFHMLNCKNCLVYKLKRHEYCPLLEECKKS